MAILVSLFSGFNILVPFSTFVQLIVPSFLDPRQDLPSDSKRQKGSSNSALKLIWRHYTTTGQL